MKEIDNQQIRNGDMTDLKIKIIIETPSTYKLSYSLLIDDIQSYQEFIFKLHDYLITLGIDNLSIFLSDFYFIRRDKLNPSSLYNSEIVTQIRINNYDEEFLNVFESLIIYNDVEMFLKMKIREESFFNKGKEKLSNKIIQMILNISGSLDFVSSQLKSDCLLNNISIWKNSYDKLKSLKNNFEKLNLKFDKYSKDKCFQYLFNLLKGTLVDMEFRINRLEKALRVNTMAKELIETVKIINI